MACWKMASLADGTTPRAVLFLDRDGVVVREKDYLRNPRDVDLLPGAAQAMAAARRAGFLLVGVSNQSGLGRGLFTAADFAAVMERLDLVLLEQGAGFDGFFYCPHAPSENCRCRKPALGLLEEAAGMVRWSPDVSWMIGDKVSDIAFGRAAGLGAILVQTGYGRDQLPDLEHGWTNDPRVMVADDLAAAVDLILKLSRGGPGE